MENTHTYTNTQLNVWWCDLYIKDKKENTFFPRLPTGRNKTESAGKGVIEEVARNRVI